MSKEDDGMRGWKECKLGDVAEVQTGPFGSQLHQSDYKSVGTPIITVEHLGENKILHLNLPLVGDKDKKRLNKYVLQEGDIVFSRVGSVDRRAYVSEKEDGWMFSGRCLRVRTNKKQVNPKFLSFYFGQESFKEHIRMIAVGATMPSINTDILSSVTVTLPLLPEQRAIASVLSSLDDKIDLLHRQNKTLEAMAETLFRQWFIEPSLNPSHRAGNVDEGWEEDSLLRLVQLVGGGTPKTSISDYWDGNIPWLAGGDIASNHKSFVLNTEKRITENGLNNSSAKLLPKYATVISARGTVGKYCLLAQPMAFSQSNYGILPRIDNCFFFTYLLINHVVEELQSSAYGSVFDTITTTTFKENKVPVPTELEIRSFENLVSLYFHKIFQNKAQIDNLEKLRDVLLPKLMCGEVRLKI
ncbi:restriction endonuclease subunit S [Candidatus Kuenenia sp.]|uniref:restriction endonuclease subunit S n=1 Tax=Candidatus Kuenenia sp. TaxID=2499824 RepID=UPI00321FDFA8